MKEELLEVLQSLIDNERKEYVTRPDKGREPAAMSEEGWERVKKHEQYVPKVYDDHVKMGRNGFYLSEDDIKNKRYKGTPTIGYGAALSPEELEAGMIDGYSIYDEFPEEAADRRMRRYFTDHPTGKRVDKKIKNIKSIIGQNQEDALRIAGYNLGDGGIKGTIGVLEGDYPSLGEGVEPAAKNLLRAVTDGGKIMPGLVKRRKEEAELLRDIDPDDVEKRYKFKLLKDIADRERNK